MSLVSFKDIARNYINYLKPFPQRTSDLYKVFLQKLFFKSNSITNLEILHKFFLLHLLGDKRFLLFYLPCICSFIWLEMLWMVQITSSSFNNLLCKTSTSSLVAQADSAYIYIYIYINKTHTHTHHFKYAYWNKSLYTFLFARPQILMPQLQKLLNMDMVVPSGGQKMSYQLMKYFITFSVYLLNMMIQIHLAERFLELSMI